MVAPHGFGYLGQALSAAEQYAAVYGAALRPGTDRVVCSPAHYVIAAYAAAAQTGLLDEAALAGYGQDGSALEAIGTERSPVPDYTCGSLGQGLSAAAGFALADRLRGHAGGQDVRVPQRRRVAGGAGLGGGDVRRALPAGPADRPARRQQFPGRRPGGQHHHHRADSRQMACVRLGCRRSRRPRRGRRGHRPGRAGRTEASGRPARASWSAAPPPVTGLPACRRTPTATSSSCPPTSRRRRTPNSARSCVTWRMTPTGPGWNRPGWNRPCRTRPTAPCSSRMATRW